MKNSRSYTTKAVGDTADSTKAEVSALRTRNRYLEALAELSRELINSHDKPTLLRAICQQLLELTEADSVYIAFLNDDRQFLEIKYLAHNKEYPRLQRMEINDGVGNKALRENRFLLIEDYQSFAQKAEHISGIQAAIGLPISQSCTVSGALALFFTDPQLAVRIQPELLELFSSFVSEALDNAAQKQRMQQERDMQSAMLDINSAMHKSYSLQGIIDSVCTRIMETFNTTRVRVYQYVDGDYFEKSGLRIHEGSVGQEVTTDPSILKVSAVQWAIDNRQSVLLKEGVKSDKESEAATAYRTKLQLGCSYIMPLLVSGHCWGVIAVHRALNSPVFQTFETRLLDMMASQLSIAVVKQQLTDDIEHDATHDLLTGLRNRASLNHQFTMLKEQQLSADNPASLLYIDLDCFKPVNDEFGHAAGDIVLGMAAERIERELSVGATAFRIGGDEFVVFVEASHSQAALLELARAIISSIEREFVVDKLKLRLSASIGIASVPLHTKCPSKLLSFADIAMYSAKHKGSGHACVYDEETGMRHMRRMALKTALKKAYRNEEFDLFFQPKVTTQTGLVEGVEALARWHHPQYGIVSPADWIPFAEQSGEIHVIGKQLLERACSWQQRFLQRGLSVNMAINISTRQLESDYFLGTLLETVERFELKANTLEIEITESVMASDLDDVSRKLDQLSKEGFKIALDDFGTGYSSLRYLQHLKLDVLKIDRSFIKDMNFQHGAFLVQTMLDIARSLNLSTVAEGVETLEQLESVVTLGVNTIQGYFYSKPVPGEKLVDIVNAINTDESNPLRKIGFGKAA